MNDQLYNELNKAWKSTCRILLGDEVGDLKEYESWLKEYFPITKERISYLSGKTTKFTLNGYCDSARFVSLDEVKEKNIDPLTINEIKDVDSILRAVSEKWEYAGNKTLGNSSHVELSDDIIDSNYVSDSINVDRGSYIFGSAYVSNSKYVFGSMRLLNNEFTIRCARQTSTKSFNCYWVVDSSNTYCSTNLVGCSEMIFCFNQRGKSKCIGNLALPADKYSALKKKLMDEIRENLKKNKEFPFIFKLVPNTPPDKDTMKAVKERTPPKHEFDLKPIERAFSSTFKILFKKEIEGMLPYQQWLSKNVVDYSFDEITSAFGSKTLRYSEKYFKLYSDFPNNRVVAYDESLPLGDLHLEEADLTNIDKIKERLSCIAYLAEEGEAGKNVNVGKTIYANNDINCYWFAGMNNELVALCPYIYDTKYAFSCNKIIASQQCIRCNNSFKLTRCFEMDSCKNCSDSYFCHNCESLTEAMFCWNIKGKRHVIGNVELPQEQYSRIKDSLLSQISDEILKNKDLNLNIYNVGCVKK